MKRDTPDRGGCFGVMIMAWESAFFYQFYSDSSGLNKSNGLNKLSGILDRDPDRFVIVPWNHHIQWTKSETYNDTKEVTEAPELAKKNYQKVLSRFFSGTSLIRC